MPWQYVSQGSKCCGQIIVPDLMDVWGGFAGPDPCLHSYLITFRKPN